MIELLHWLGFCPCNTAHFDVMDLLIYLSAVPAVASLALVRVANVLRARRCRAPRR